MMRHVLLFLTAIVFVSGCGPDMPPRGVHLVNLSSADSIRADSLARALTSRYLAVPDSIVRTGGELRVRFLHAPFAGWTEPDCSMQYGGSREVAYPVARALWETLGEPGQVERIILVTRSKQRTVRRFGGYTRCGGGEGEWLFYPRDFPAPIIAAGLYVPAA